MTLSSVGVPFDDFAKNFFFFAFNVELCLWRFCLLPAMLKSNRILIGAIVFERSSSSCRITIFLPAFVDLYRKRNLLILETNTKLEVVNNEFLISSNVYYLC